jgi:hypothetical protein
MSDCHVGYDVEAGCVTMRWRAYRSFAAFRDDNERVLQAIAAHGASRLLGEIETLGPISPADQQWLAADWIPRAVRQGLRRVALVTPAFHLDHGPVLLVGERVSALLDLAYFEEPEAARAWLRPLHAA